MLKKIAIAALALFSWLVYGMMSGQEELSWLISEHLKHSNVNLNKWTVARSPVGGRGIFATEDLKAGELIFVDHALIKGPRFSSVIQMGCSNCYDGTEDLLKCDRCHLPLCSETCRENENHLRECNVIVKWNKLSEDIDSNMIARSLVPIRSLLMNATERQLSCALQANALPRHGSEITQLKTYFDIGKEEEEFMRLVCYILDANAFEIPGRENRMSLRGLFPISALLNHSCVPNTQHYFDETDNLYMKATKTIPKGGELFCCYARSFWGTPARRHHLHSTKHFLCNCDRCADPTEFGTYLAALKCFVTGCGGLLLPLDSLNGDSDWICKSCEARVTKSQIGILQSAMGNILGTLDFDDPPQITEFLNRRLLKFIPSSNQIIVELKWRLVWLLGVKEGYEWMKLSAESLIAKEQLCRELSNLYEQLRAGRTTLLGLLLYHLHCCIAERLRRDHTLLNVLKDELRSTILDACNILKDDVTSPADLESRRDYVMTLNNDLFD